MPPPTDVGPQEAARELVWRRSNPHTGGGFLYFFEHVWKVQQPRKGAVHPTPRPFQTQLAELISTAGDDLSLVVLKARQIGLTTVVAAYAVWWCIFHSDSPWLMASRNESAAQKNLGRAAYGWRRLPAWFRERCPALTADTTERMVWANDSRIESIPASAASGRSDSVYGVLFDEAAHMETPGDLYASLEPLCYGPFIVFSSANGMGGWFHDLYWESKQPDSEWVGRFYGWREVAERDQEWFERTRRKFRGQEWALYQEHPSNDVEAFARSGRVVYGPDLLDDREWEPPRCRYGWNQEAADFGRDRPLVGSEQADLELWVWEEPQVERDGQGRTLRPPNYVVFCDPAEGLTHGDQTAICVWDANRQQVVATSLSWWPIEDLDVPLAQIGYWYHTALLMVERNNHGLVPITGLSRRLHYPRLYRMATLGEIPHGDRTARYGWVTSRTSKPKMVHDFLGAMRDGLVEVRDPRWKVQAATFVSDGKGGYEASEGGFDDLMMAVIGGWQGVREVGQYPVVWVDDTPQPPTWGDVLALDTPPHPATSSMLRIGSHQQRPAGGHPSFTLWPLDQTARG